MNVVGALKSAMMVESIELVVVKVVGALKCAMLVETPQAL